MGVVHEFPDRVDSWSHEYWLRHCENYRVDTPDGPIGFVEKVLFSQEGEPEALAIRVGRFQPHLVLVRLAEVAEISPDREVLVLQSVPRV